MEKCNSPEGKSSPSSQVLSRAESELESQIPKKLLLRSTIKKITAGLVFLGGLGGPGLIKMIRGTGGSISDLYLTIITLPIAIGISSALADSGYKDLEKYEEIVKSVADEQTRVGREN